MDGQIKNMIESADYTALTILKDKLTSGSFNITETINKRIKEMEMSHAKYCPVCGNDILPESVNNYTIIFGPESFKKKASFCAVDCLTYFLQNMKAKEEVNAKNSLESNAKKKLESQVYN